MQGPWSSFTRMSIMGSCNGHKYLFYDNLSPILDVQSGAGGRRVEAAAGEVKTMVIYGFIRGRGDGVIEIMENTFDSRGIIWGIPG